jgi:hypothetical protein
MEESEESSASSDESAEESSASSDESAATVTTAFSGIFLFIGFQAVLAAAAPSAAVFATF